MIIEGVRLDSNDDPSLFSSQEVIDQTILAPIYMKISSFDSEFPPLDGKSLMIIGYVNNAYIRCSQLIGDVFILDKFYNDKFDVDWIDYTGKALFNKTLIISNPESLGLDRDEIHQEYYDDSLVQDFDVVELKKNDLDALKSIYQQRDAIREMITFYVDLVESSSISSKLSEYIGNYQDALEKTELELIKKIDTIKDKYIPGKIKSQESTILYDIDINKGNIMFYGKQRS